MSCAGAAPFLHTAQPARPGRVHVVAGGLVAAPLGPLAREGRPGRTSGVGPLARVHVGLPESLELRAGWVGDAGTLGARWAPALDALRKWCFTAGLDLGLGLPGERLGPRLGADVAVGFGRTWSDLFHVWMLATAGGSRAAADGVGDVAATRVRGGAILGLGVGFRRLHALVELAAGVEHESADEGRTGVYLVPGFALALRL